MTTKLKRLSENLGKHKSLEKDMLASGYSASTAKQQTMITATKGFKELLQTYLPMTDAFKVTKDAQKAVKYDPIQGPTPDHNVRLKAADQVYKLHGVITPDSERGQTVTINVMTYGEGDILNATQVKTEQKP